MDQFWALEYGNVQSGSVKARTFVDSLPSICVSKGILLHGISRMVHVCYCSLLGSPIAECSCRQEFRHFIWSSVIWNCQTKCMCNLLRSVTDCTHCRSSRHETGSVLTCGTRQETGSVLTCGTHHETGSILTCGTRHETGSVLTCGTRHETGSVLTYGTCHETGSILMGHATGLVAYLWDTSRDW